MLCEIFNLCDRDGNEKGQDNASDPPVETGTKIRRRKPLFIAAAATLVLAAAMALGIAAHRVVDTSKRAETTSPTGVSKTTAHPYRAEKSRHSEAQPDKGEVVVEVKPPVTPVRQADAPSPQETALAAQSESPTAIKPNPKRAVTGEADRRQADEYSEQGKVSLANMRFDTARELFEKAVGINPNTPEAWFGLARVNYEEKQYRSALIDINRALSLRNSARWRVFRGEIHLAIGDKKAATAEWQSVIDDFKNDPVAVEAAARKLAQIGAEPAKPEE